MLIKKNNWIRPQWIVVLFSAIFLLDSCSHSESKEKEKGEKALALPVYEVKRSDAVTVKTYLVTIEGKVTVEVRPQVDGLIKDNYID
mgnify:CR=1 FL=1